MDTGHSPPSADASPTSHATSEWSLFSRPSSPGDGKRSDQIPASRARGKQPMHFGELAYLTQEVFGTSAFSSTTTTASQTPAGVETSPTTSASTSTSTSTTSRPPTPGSRAASPLQLFDNETELTLIPEAFADGPSSSSSPIQPPPPRVENFCSIFGGYDSSDPVAVEEWDFRQAEEELNRRFCKTNPAAYGAGARPIEEDPSSSLMTEWDDEMPLEVVSSTKRRRDGLIPALPCHSSPLPAPRPRIRRLSSSCPIDIGMCSGGTCPPTSSGLYLVGLELRSCDTHDFDQVKLTSSLEPSRLLVNSSPSIKGRVISSLAQALSKGLQAVQGHPGSFGAYAVKAGVCVVSAALLARCLTGRIGGFGALVARVGIRV